MNTRTRSKLIGAVVAGALALAACAESTPISAPADDGDSEAASAPAPLPPGAAATIGTTSLGDIIVGGDGLTLYGFTNDTAAASTCYGTCADAWPPVIVDPDWTVAPDLDSGIFATTTRDDGRLQLVAGKWPLYFFAGDVVPGDLNGQGSGDVWFVVGTDGALLTSDVAPRDDRTEANGQEATSDGSGQTGSVVATADTDLGQILVDADGLSLYGFTDDADGVPTCVDGCAEAWPPVIVDALPPGLDPEVFSLVERPDGSTQLRSGLWPLYRFAGDAAPGQLNGQGSGGVWFLAAPDGSLVRDTGAGSQDGDGGYGS